MNRTVRVRLKESQSNLYSTYREKYLLVRSTVLKNRFLKSFVPISFVTISVQPILYPRNLRFSILCFFEQRKTILVPSIIRLIFVLPLLKKKKKKEIDRYNRSRKNKIYSSLIIERIENKSQRLGIIILVSWNSKNTKLTGDTNDREVGWLSKSAGNEVGRPAALVTKLGVANSRLPNNRATMRNVRAQTSIWDEKSIRQKRENRPGQAKPWQPVSHTATVYNVPRI